MAERYAPTIPSHELRPADVPPGVEGHTRVPKDPSNMIRDVFLLNDGRLTVRQTEAMCHRLAFTYGWAVWDAWTELLDGDLGWERDGDDFVNRIQEALAN